MKKLLIDVDEVICDPGFLYLVNKFLGTSYKISDFTEYYIDDIIGSEERRQEFYRWRLQYNQYDYATIFEDAYDVLTTLNEKYEIYIFSACVDPFMKENSGIFFKQKFDFLVREFPFLNPDKFIFSNSKNLITADIQIDDRLSNLQSDIPVKLLFDSYHNKNHTTEELAIRSVTRVSSWKDIEQILLH